MLKDCAALLDFGGPCRRAGGIKSSEVLVGSLLADSILATLKVTLQELSKFRAAEEGEKPQMVDAGAVRAAAAAPAAAGPGPAG